MRMIFRQAEIGDALGRKRWDRALLTFFGIAFLARLIERLVYVVHLAGKPLDFKANFGMTEWLINYAGGFQRRGLPGAIVHGLYSAWHVPPGISIVVACLVLYGVFFAWLWNRSKGIVPRWVLLTTPLLGYPVFIDRVLIRKDFLILLILAISLGLISANKGRIYDLIASLVLSLGIFSYELLAFLGLPAVVFLLLFRSYATSEKGCIDFCSVIKRSWQSLVFMLIPIAAFTAVLVYRGTQDRSGEIALSWKDAYDPSLPFPGAQGAMAWLALPSSKYIADSQAVLSMKHFGIPLWFILIVASVSGILFIASAIGQQSRIRAWFFSWTAIFQFFFMSILFYHSWDHGRWIVLCLLSAFLIAVQVPLGWQVAFADVTRFPSSLEGFVMPYWFAPLGLAFWGVEIFSWSPYGWIAASPIGIVLQVYFYLRVLGFSRPW
jgi:hypothetical protein